MDNDRQGERLQICHGFFKNRKRVASVDKSGGVFMHGLQSQLYPDKFPGEAFL